jgi:hypothetical protein
VRGAFFFSVSICRFVALRGMPLMTWQPSYLSLLFFCLFFPVKKYVFRNELRGANRRFLFVLRRNALCDCGNPRFYPIHYCLPPIPFPPSARLPRYETLAKTEWGGLLTKGSSLLFPYSEPVKPFGRLTTKDEMGQSDPLIPDPSPLREKAKREGVCTVLPE